MPSQNVERFITSFMQAIDGCGALQTTSYSEDTRVTHAVHLDGCAIDIPDEVIAALTPEQMRRVRSGGITTPTPAPAAPPADIAVTIDQPRIQRSMSTEGRTESALENSTSYGPLAMTSRDRIRSADIYNRRGERFIGLLSICGITLPPATRRVVGQILQHMYGDIEAKAIRTIQREQSLQDDYRARIRQADEAIAEYKEASRKAVESATKLEKLHAAAIAWRETSVEDDKPVEKFAKFQALMSAIDATPADGLEDTEMSVELPSPELTVPEQVEALQPF